MRFHPDKCKLLKVTTMREREMDKFPYHLGSKYLDYIPVEKDLGVKMTTNLSWNEQWDSIIKGGGGGSKVLGGPKMFYCISR